MRYLFQIDKEKEAEADEALSILEDRLIRTLDACAFGIILFDANGNCLSLNNRWQQLYHLGYDEMKDYNMLQDPVIKTKHIWDAVRDSFRGEAGILDENYFTPEEWDKPGRGCWTKGYALPLFRESSKTQDQIGQALILEDVTKAKILQEEVRDLTARVQEIHSAQNAIVERLSELYDSDRQKEVRNVRVLPAILELKEKTLSIPRREREVFEKLAQGWTVKEAAHQLNLGIKSVYTYRARLLKRLRLSSDVELAIAWRELQDQPSRS